MEIRNRILPLVVIATICLAITALHSQNPTLAPTASYPATLNPVISCRPPRRQRTRDRRPGQQQKPLSRRPPQPGRRHMRDCYETLCSGTNHHGPTSELPTNREQSDEIRFSLPMFTVRVNGLAHFSRAVKRRTSHRQDCREVAFSAHRADIAFGTLY